MNYNELMDYKRFWVLSPMALGAKLKRKKIRKKRLRDALDPNNDATLEDVMKLVPLDGPKFMNNIGLCFPVFIKLVSEGVYLSDIARMFQMKRQQLVNVMVRNPDLYEQYRKAKKIARDIKANRIKPD